MLLLSSVKREYHQGMAPPPVVWLSVVLLSVLVVPYLPVALSCLLLVLTFWR